MTFQGRNIDWPSALRDRSTLSMAQQEMAKMARNVRRMTATRGSSARPPHFLPEEAQKVADGITELADKYTVILDSVSD